MSDDLLLSTADIVYPHVLARVDSSIQATAARQYAEHMGWDPEPLIGAIYQKGGGKGGNGRKGSPGGGGGGKGGPKGGAKCWSCGGDHFARDGKCPMGTQHWAVAKGGVAKGGQQLGVKV